MLKAKLILKTAVANIRNQIFKFQIQISSLFLFLNNNGVLIRKNVIELNRYSGFVKHEFKTNNETIYRTGYCELSKKQKLF